MVERRRLADSRRGTKTFDVICVGEALWELAGSNVDVARSDGRVFFRPGSGVPNVSLSLARQGFRVGIATVLHDDEAGRALVERLAAAGVDIGGVERSRSSAGLVFVRGGARQVVPVRELEQPVEVPYDWSSSVLLVSGVSPVVQQTGSSCRAARAARRVGSAVVIDLNARFHQWRGRDPRALYMLLREADVVWCAAEDLLALNIDVPRLRSAMRPSAALVMSDGVRVQAFGAFGEVRASREVPLPPMSEDDHFSAAICAELALLGRFEAERAALFVRALDRGYASAAASLRV